MKKLILSLAAAFVMLGIGPASGKPINKTIDKSNLDWLQKWFNAWELVCNQILHLPTATAPEMVFFDSVNVFTTSIVTAPEGSLIEGPKFFDQKLSWRIMPHNGQLTLPDGQKVPVGLMSFAGPAKDGKSFFVMAAPSYWEAAGVTSDELGLDKLITGVFLHEFAHIRQFKGFGRQIDTAWNKHAFGEIELSDDIVQGHFKKDSNYVKDFKTEANKFYVAAFAKSKQETKLIATQALDLLATRQQKYFTGNKTVLKELDNIFLSMEGVGQFVGVAWLTHPQGGSVPFQTAVKGFRRKGNQWSQEEGLALFLVLNKLSKPGWAKEMFSENPTNIIDLLKKAVGKKQAN